MHARILAVAMLMIALTLASAAPRGGRVEQRNRGKSVFQFNDEIKSLTDVKRLEDLAGRTDDDLVRELGMDDVICCGATTRINAYARLGELGTPESLAAARRIEAAAKQWPTTPETVSRTFSPHPAIGTGPFVPIAQTTGGDGVRYGIVLAGYLGPPEAFLVSTRSPADARSWTRPKLIPRLLYPGEAHDARLTRRAPDQLVLTFRRPVMPYETGKESTLAADGRPMARFGPNRWPLSITDIERDTDGDGWTDLEEARLGLDPCNPDTDGDGLPDGRDPAPAYRAPAADASYGANIALEKAFFTAFGLTHSRYVLYIRPNSPRFQVWGYKGPVLFGREIPDRNSPWFGETYVEWKITNLTDTEAQVTIADREGGNAGEGQEVLLRKYGGEWFVVKQWSTWIS